METRKSTKRSMALCLVFVLLFSMISFFAFPGEALAFEETLYITLKVNGHVIVTDVWPYIKDECVFVPIRFVTEALGAEVEWCPEERKVLVTREDRTVEIWHNSNKMVVNGEPSTMDASVEVLNGRTMIPVEYIAKSLDFTTELERSTYTLMINREGAEVPASCIATRDYTDEDIIWLSRIVNIEAMGLSMEGKLAVANVVLNRKNSPSFPNTVHDVIFQIDVYKQFPPAHRSGFRESVADLKSVIAAKMALEGINNIDRCLFFNCSPFKGKDGDLYKVIEGEYFYY